MRFKSFIVALGAAMLFTAGSLAAQNNNIIIADSSSSGTYKTMLAEIKDVCATDTFTITDLPQNGGAPDNLDALVNNKASAAFMHSDVIYSAAMLDPNMKNLKTLVALYPEEIHVVALRTSKATRGGYGGYFAKPVEFNSLSDLNGFAVGAAGGGVITLRILSGQAGGNFAVTPYPSGSDVINALKAGQIHAAIFVGGSPLDIISKLDGAIFKLLPLGDNLQGRLPGVYKPATINYGNLQSGTIKTAAPQALLITRKYTTPRMIAPQAAFRDCFYKNLEDMKETPGKHPKWQLVDPTDHGVWEWYDIPATASTLSKAPISTRK